MLSIIVAISENNVIGKDNQLIQDLPKDLQRFKKITTNHVMIMGRKTFESLPGVLPYRHHIVLTKNKDYIVHNKNVTVIHSIPELFSLLNPEEEHFIIGGGHIYNILLPFTEKIYLTKINQVFQGDTLFPQIDINNNWDVLEEEDGVLDEHNQLPHKFLILKRKEYN